MKDFHLATMRLPNPDLVDVAHQNVSSNTLNPVSYDLTPSFIAGFKELLCDRLGHMPYVIEMFSVFVLLSNPLGNP